MFSRPFLQRRPLRSSSISSFDFFQIVFIRQHNNRSTILVNLITLFRFVNSTRPPGTFRRRLRRVTIDDDGRGIADPTTQARRNTVPSRVTSEQKAQQKFGAAQVKRRFRRQSLSTNRPLVTGRGHVRLFGGARICGPRARASGT